MRLLVLILCLSLAFAFENHQQTRKNAQHSPEQQHSSPQEGNNYQNANSNANFLQKEGGENLQMDQDGAHQNLRTKATIFLVVLILICLIVKKCYQNKNNINSTEQKYAKQQTNNREQQRQLDDSHECPIVISFDIETIKSKYLIENYGVNVSKLSETCAQPIIMMQ